MNEDDERATEPGEGVLPGTGGGTGPAQWSAQGSAQSQSTGDVLEDVQGAVPELTVEEQMRGPLFARFRALFHDVPDRKFDEVVAALLVPESINSIARGLIEQNYFPHLHPGSVRMYLTRLRDAMGSAVLGAAGRSSRPGLRRA